jgi:hypothetical protein
MKLGRIAKENEAAASATDQDDDLIDLLGKLGSAIKDNSRPVDAPRNARHR